MAQPFDDTRLQPIGDPLEVAAQGSFTFTSPQVAASAAADGTLAYLAGRSRGSQLTWFDRNGKDLGKVGPRANQISVVLSPDGNTVAINRQDPNGQGALWMHDLVRGSESRLTPAGSPGGGTAIWSPDSSRIWFGMIGPEGPGIYQKDIKSGTLEQVEKRDPAATAKALSDWSRDGRFLIYTENDPKTRADIWYVPLESGKPDGKPVRLLGTDAVENQGQVSPNGKWLAYSSHETGRIEVHIRPFPTGADVWKVSVDGGREPRWRDDSMELFFTSTTADRVALMAWAVVPDGRGGLRTGPPQKLFDFRALTIVPQSNVFVYSPHPDGQRFLINAQTETGAPTINVITNWQKAVGAAK